MQDCAKYDIMLNDRVDGTLSRKDAKELDKHLAVCADCRKYLQLLEDIRDGLHEDLPDPPEALREGIMYKIGLEKRRKFQFGAMGRWTAIAAVLCIVVFGVVKLNGSGVMGSKASAPEAAAPAAYSVGGMAEAENAVQDADVDGNWLMESKLGVAAMPAPTEAPAQENSTVVKTGGSAAMEDRAEAPAASEGDSFGTVYDVLSLQGYDRARAALDSGSYWGVCVFYDRLPEGVPADSWEAEKAGDGELERWQLSAEELRVLENSSDWNEFYYGDLNAGRGLVIVIAGEEE